jgi:hypothetical protein
LSDLTKSIVALAGISGARFEVTSNRNVRLAILVKRQNTRLAAFCLLMVSLLPLDAFAQVRESLLPTPKAPGAPQEQPSEFAPLGLRVGDFFWFPRAELDAAYNSNVFATSTGHTTGALINALTSSFDLLSNFPRNSLNLHADSLSQFYVGHAAQNTQDGIISADGTLDVTAGSFLYGNAQVAHQHIAFGSPNSPGDIAQPVTFWGYNAAAGYYAGGRRFTYGVDFGVSAAQYNAAQLVGGGVLPQSSQNAIAYSAAVHGGYEIIPDYVGYIRVGGTLFDYLRIPVGQISPNFSTYRVDLGLQISPRHLISGDAYVGYLVQNFSQSSFGSTSTPDFGGDLTWSITRLTTLTFTGLFTFNTGTPGTSIPLAGNSYLSKIFTGGVSHQLLPNLQLGFTGTYISNSFQGVSRTDNVFIVSGGLRYQVNRNLYLGVDGYYAEQSSTAAGAAFTQQGFTLRAATQF